VILKVQNPLGKLVAVDKKTIVGIGQVLSRKGEMTIRNDHRMITAIVGDAGDGGINRLNADGLGLAFELDSLANIIFGSNNINAVVVGSFGILNLVALIFLGVFWQHRGQEGEG